MLGASMPNLGASQLKANLQRVGHRAEVLYLNFPFAKRIGVWSSEYLSNRIQELFGEFVFSAALFGDEAGRVDAYVNDVLAGTDTLRIFRREFSDPPVTVLSRWREDAIAFCDGEGLQAILDREPTIVGFSSSFQQNCASLALMERLKRARPDVVTVIGGANCEDEMGVELMARFPAIDYVGQGECDHSFVALVDALAAGQTGRGIPGMLSREEPAAAIPIKPLTSEELDDLPYPDLDDFFEQREAHGIDQHVPPVMLMESSRGCWWGVKHHCTFCGLNGESMGFRSKSPQRVLDEIDWLVDRYGPRRIRMADNILDMKYFKTILPHLAESKRTTLFYETKANLTRGHVQLLAEARVNMIQPGIENLSDESLRLMRKGVTKLQCIQLLQWSGEYGVSVDWNYLIGFPGENDAELTEIAEEMELLHHLEPPRSFRVLRIDRFSPHHASAEHYGFAPLRPHKAYRHTYPFPAESLARLAYFFDSDAIDRKWQSPELDVLGNMVRRWWKNHRRSFLYAIPRRKNLIVLDTRRRARRRIHRLSGLRREVYEYCDRARGLADITRTVAANRTPEAIEEAVESLVRDRLVLAAGGRYLSLGIEPGKVLTFEDDPATAKARTHRYSGLEDRVGRKGGPITAIRRAARRLRLALEDARGRWTRRVLMAVVSLFKERESPRKPAFRHTD